MYLDSSYIAKFYLNEADSPQVRAVIATGDTLVSTALAIAEVACTFHRKFREGNIDGPQCHELLRAFRHHTEAGLWTFAPVTVRVLSRLASVLNVIPATTYVRSGDAVHLATASDLGEQELWSNDRHLLAAAPAFGLMGRSA